MILNKANIDKHRQAKAQFDEVAFARNAATDQERKLHNNEGLIPQDVYKKFDTDASEIMRSMSDHIALGDLMGSSKFVNIGTLVHQFRQVSDAGVAQTSMSGQTGIKFDQVEHKYDGTIIPIYDTGFFRNFREWDAQRSEGYDGLVDDNREHTYTLRDKINSGLFDGHKDKDGNTIVVDGLSWAGMRADTRVNQVSLVFDFTDTAQTGDAIKNAFINEIRNVLWITNNSNSEVTVYVSKLVAANFERKFSTQYDTNTVSQELQNLMGVASIKVDSTLVGNEVMAFSNDGRSIIPIVGMGINTVAMPRPMYNSNYAFTVWSAIGFQVRSDYDGKTSALFAQ